MGKHTQKKSGFKRLISKFIKRKSQTEDGGSPESAECSHYGVVTNSQQPNEGQFEELVDSSVEERTLEDFASSDEVKRGSCSKRDVIRIGNMPVDSSLPRTRKPHLFSTKEEENVLHKEKIDSAIAAGSSVNSSNQSSHSTSKPSSPSTEKAMQMLQKFQARRKGEPDQEKILEKTKRRSRSNKQVLEHMSKSRTDGLEESSYESIGAGDTCQSVSKDQTKVSQLLQKFEAKKLGNSAQDRMPERSAGQRSRTNNLNVKHLENQQHSLRLCNVVSNTATNESEESLGAAMNNDSMQEAHKSNSLFENVKKSSNVNKSKHQAHGSITEDVKMGKPLASSTLEKERAKCSKEPKSPKEDAVVKKKRQRQDNVLSLIQKHDKSGDSEHRKLMEESDKENKNVINAGQKERTRKSGEGKDKQKKSDDRFLRKRSAKLSDKTSMQPLIKRLDDKIPMTISSNVAVLNTKVHNGLSQYTSSPLATTSTATHGNNSELINSSTSGENPARPIIHYHVTIQNCDGININVNKSDHTVLPQSVEVTQDGKVQKLSWVEDPSASQTPGHAQELMGTLTSSSESWSGTSGSTIVAGHSSISDGHSMVSGGTNTTVLMSADINCDDAISEMTCDTMYLLDADAWGCDAFLDEEMDHLSVCKHKDMSDNIENKHIKRTTSDSFHLNRQNSLSRSVPSRIPRYCRTKSSPSLTKTTEKEFVPPWRSESTNSVVTKSKKLQKDRQKSGSMQNLEHSQSYNSIGKSRTIPQSPSENCVKPKHLDKTQSASKSNKPAKKATKSETKSESKSNRSTPSRLFHNLLHPGRSSKKECMKTSVPVQHVGGDSPSNARNINSSLPISADDQQERPSSYSSSFSASSQSAFVPLNTKSTKNSKNKMQLQNFNRTKTTRDSVKREENAKSSKIKDSGNKVEYSKEEMERFERNDTSIQIVEPKNSNLEKKKDKPVAKVIPVARVSPQPTASSTTTQSNHVRNITTSPYSPAAISAQHTSTATPFMNSLTSSGTTLPSGSTSSAYTSPAMINSTSSLVRSYQSSTAASSPYTPGYSFPTTSFRQRYTPIFVSTEPTTSLSVAQSASNSTQSNSNTHRAAVIATRSVTSSVMDPVLRNEHDSDGDSTSSSSSSEENEQHGGSRTTSAVYDDSTLSLLNASPHVVFVDEDLDVTASRQNFRRFGLGSTIQPTLGRQRRGNRHERSSRSRSSCRGSTLEERVALLSAEIVRVPGVLILSTRRNRMVVYLSQDRPNTDGVFQFMQEHRVSRADYEVEVLPWGQRPGTGRSASVAPSLSSSRRTSGVSLTMQT